MCIIQCASRNGNYAHVYGELSCTAARKPSLSLAIARAVVHPRIFSTLSYVHVHKRRPRNMRGVGAQYMSGKGSNGTRKEELRTYNTTVILSPELNSLQSNPDLIRTPHLARLYFEDARAGRAVGSYSPNETGTFSPSLTS